MSTTTALIVTQAMDRTLTREDLLRLAGPDLRKVEGILYNWWQIAWAECQRRQHAVKG